MLHELTFPQEHSLPLLNPLPWFHGPPYLPSSLPSPVPCPYLSYIATASLVGTLVSIIPISSSPLPTLFTSLSSLCLYTLLFRFTRYSFVTIISFFLYHKPICCSFRISLACFCFFFIDQPSYLQVMRILVSMKSFFSRIDRAFGNSPLCPFVHSLQFHGKTYGFSSAVRFYCFWDIRILSLRFT